jgi:hypothetical protein
MLASWADTNGATGGSVSIPALLKNHSAGDGTYFVDV